jgi:hypothetical protein
MRIAAIIGESASGKSAIGHALFKKLGEYEKFHGWVFGTLHHKYKVAVLGNYDDPKEKFSGTDVFAPAAIPQEVGAWLQRLKIERPDWSVFFEGNRLGSPAFFSYYVPAPIGDIRIHIATVSEQERRRRHSERGTGMEPDVGKLDAYQKSKAEYLQKLFPISCRTMKNDTADQLKQNVNAIFGFLTVENAQ